VKIFQRHGVDISRKTMGGWLAQCAGLLNPLYGSMAVWINEGSTVPV
jgi:hypothetical protein